MSTELERLAYRRAKVYSSGAVEGFEAFCRECVFITGGDDESGDTSAVQFKWWGSQRELAAALCDPGCREIIILKSRQIGITWLVLAWKLWRVMFWEGIEERITSVGQEEASKALRRVKFMIEHLPEWMKPTLEISNTTTIKIAETQSWITALPATINAGRGDTLNDILSDEAAFQVYAKQIVTSARPALEKRHGKLIVNSTANGVGNYFAEEYFKAEKGANGYRPFFFGWRSDPTRTQEWYDSMLKKHGPEYMHENYPETAAEAFLASSMPFFSQERLGEDILKSYEFHDGFLDKNTFHPAPRGSIRVWEKPIPGEAYVLFVDPAEGKEHSDNTNAYVLRVHPGFVDQVCRINGKLDVVDTADLSCAVSLWYGSGPENDRRQCLTAVERNSMGVAVIARMLDAGHNNMWVHRNLTTGEIKDGTYGWYTTGGIGGGGSRGYMLGKLQAEYRMGRVVVRDQECIEEMVMFAFIKGKAQAPPGKTDDRVMSLAGAVTIAIYEVLTENSSGDEIDPTLCGARLAAVQDIRRMKGNEEKPLNEGVEEVGG